MQIPESQLKVMNLGFLAKCDLGDFAEVGSGGFSVVVGPAGSRKVPEVT